jgi:hypothetical protein
MPVAVMPRSALLTWAEGVTSATETPVHQIAIRCALPYAKCLRWALRQIFIWPVADDEHHQVCASALRPLKEPRRQGWLTPLLSFTAIVFLSLIRDLDSIEGTTTSRFCF